MQQKLIIVRVNGVWGTFSWLEGYKLFSKERSLLAEARDYPEAVINRLIREDRWDEAEDIMDRFM